MQAFDFEGLFVFDLANNHQGDLKHGLAIIDHIAKAAHKHRVRAGLKFQFRHLDTLIHPDYKNRNDVKHIPRFISTRLSLDDYAKMTQVVRDAGMTTICTPFDETSVDHLLDLDIQVIKIASCSASDRPLVERVARANRPVIVSTAGLALSQIDRLVSYFQHRNVPFGIMHCVAMYPTPNDKLSLNQIRLLRSRYPGVPIGWSTHEDPAATEPVQIAYALGARMFERHVGLPTEQYQLNSYSSTPEQIDHWLNAYKRAVQACGGDYRAPGCSEERLSLKSLMRGVWAKTPIQKGQVIFTDNVQFAMPLQDHQLDASHWGRGLTANRDYAPGEPIDSTIAQTDTSKQELLSRIVLQTRAMLNDAKLSVSPKSKIEVSHHYGLERFREFGCVIVDCINRSYCKKLIIQLPRQKHPYHHHQKKEESFQLLHGDLEIELDGHRSKLQPGDIITVSPGVWHKFHTLDGAIFEEVSTTHFNNDSYYEDAAIATLSRDKRKTKIDNWETLATSSFQVSRRTKGKR